MSNIASTVVDTISSKPELGIFGSLIGVALSPIEIISLVSAILGISVTVLTLIIKIIDIRQKMKRKSVAQDDIIVENKRYRHIPDADE